MIWNNPIHILFASRLVYEKGVEILIEAIEYSLSEKKFDDKIIWHVCSSGTYRDDILDLLKKYPERVIYHGSVSQIWLATLYRQVDFLFMPSLFLETFGLTALESLACGTPVIWFQKGWLTAFIPDVLALDATYPVRSFISILEKIRPEDYSVIDVNNHSEILWREKLVSLLW
jgi:glycosyltransferase involved in cell wall biosynthesis